MKDIRAEAVEVIRITRVAGSGTEKDPVRAEIQYWEKNGKLIAKRDQTEEISSIASQ